MLPAHDRAAAKHTIFLTDVASKNVGAGQLLFAVLAPSGVAARSLSVALDGAPPQTLDFDGGTNCVSDASAM